MAAIQELYTDSDVNDQEEVSRTAGSEDSRKDFYTNMTHEFKTPLNIMLSTIQLMEFNANDKSRIDKKNYRKYIRLLKQNVYRMIRMTNNLIDINKLECGFYELHLKNVNIVSIVEDIAQSVAPYAKDRDIDLIFDTDAEELIIACDPDKLERIMLNLLSNAIKFTNPGGLIKVNIHIEGESVDIIVEDNGIGIPEVKTGKLFDRFVQVDQSSHYNKGGSGIGLSLVKSLVENHGGSVGVESRVGEGCRLTVSLPCRQVDTEVENNASITDEGPSNRLVELIHVEFSDIYTPDDEYGLEPD